MLWYFWSGQLTKIDRIHLDGIMGSLTGQEKNMIMYVYKTYNDFVVNMVSANRRKKCDGAHNRSSARVR